MKRKAYLLTAIPAILLGAAGCQQEVPEMPESACLTVSIADEPLDTRAAFGDIDGKFSWTKGD